MNQEELIEFLKKNMKIRIQEKNTSVSNAFTVSIYIGNTKICESERFCTGYCEDDFV